MEWPGLPDIRCADCLAIKKPLKGLIDKKCVDMRTERACAVCGEQLGEHGKRGVFGRNGTALCRECITGIPKPPPDFVEEAAKLKTPREKCSEREADYSFMCLARPERSFDLCSACVEDCGIEISEELRDFVKSAKE
jgi:hypothetical protein